MRKNVFLTSMLALVVASPAFADWPYGVGVNGDGNGYIGARIIENGAAVNSAACNVVPLTYNGETPDSGTFYLTADWGRDECTIKLDPSRTRGGDASNPDPFGTLYSKYGLGAYLDINRTNLMSTNDNGLGQIPQGAQIAAYWHVVAPDGHNVNEIVHSIYSDATTGRRAFNGFFSETSDGVKYIDNAPVDNEYHITEAGTTAAGNIAKDSNGRCPDTTWYAQWGCADISFPADPELKGYKFEGWYDAATGGNKITEICDRTLNLYTHWSPRTYKVEYDCMGGSLADGLTWLANPDVPDAVAEAGKDYVTYESTQYTFKSSTNVCEPPADSSSVMTGWNCEFQNEEADIPVDLETIPWSGSRLWDIDSDLKCYANWSGLHNLTYDCGDNGISNSTQAGATFITGGEFDILSNKNYGTCGKIDGISFKGWLCDGYTNNCNTDSSCTITNAPDGNISCTAQWETNEINLVWVYDNATDDDEGTSNQNTTCLYNSEAGTAGGIGGATGLYYNQTTNPDGIPVPVKTGYTFKGWVVTNHED